MIKCCPEGEFEEVRVSLKNPISECQNDSDVSRRQISGRMLNTAKSVTNRNDRNVTDGAPAEQNTMAQTGPEARPHETDSLICSEPCCQRGGAKIKPF